MKSTILDIIQTSPKHYVRIVKHTPELYQWVVLNSLIESDQFAAMIYSAVNSQSNICQYGNVKKFSRWGTGFTGCGPANVCKCTNEQISASTKHTKLAVSDDNNATINAKRKSTMLAKYGVEYNSQRSDVKLVLKKSKVSDYATSRLTDCTWMHTEYVINKRSSVDIAKELNVYYSTVIEYCRHYNFTIRPNSNYSLVELEIINYIQSLGINCEQGNRSVLSNKEIDVYVDSHKFGIEVNGLYWHSYHPDQHVSADALLKFKTRHINKTTAAADAGVQLFHITDWEWTNQQSIIKSILLSKFGQSTRIFARSCKLVMLSTATARQFFDTTHLQGFIAATYYIGLEYNGEVVMAISAGRSRYSKTAELELYRLSSKLDVSVIGGGSKLLTELQRLSPNTGIVSYCDRSKSNGNGYTAMGFSLESTSGPGYCWTTGNETISRYKCSPKRLSRWLPTYDPQLSETANMFNAGYRQLWDCGNFVFKLTGK